MKLFSRFSGIIGLLLTAALLQGCGGMLKVAYNQAPDALYWWLDGYFDFNEAQTLRLRPDLEALQAWHRGSELPAYAALLQKARRLAVADVTHAQACELFTEGRVRALAVVDRIEPTVTSIAPTLDADQIALLEKEFDKRNRKWRSEWIEGSPQERSAHRVKEAVARAERFYGRLEERQLAVIRATIARSSYDPRASYREALRRQQDALAVLRTLRAAQPAPAKIRAEVKALFVRSLDSPDPAYRGYVDTITREGCAAVADLHNATTPAQRDRAGKTLQEYEDDVRALMRS